jgi:hypothetical protein
MKEVLMNEMTTRRDQEAATATKRPSAMMLIRAVIVIAAVALIGIAAFMEWIDGVTGDTLSFRALWQTDAGTTTELIRSIAAGALAVAIVGLLGLATLNGWLLRLAGAVGLIGTFLLLVQIGRADLSIVDTTDPGLWMFLAGSAILLIAGFVPTTKTVTSRSETVRVPEAEEKREQVHASDTRTSEHTTH